MKRVSLFILLTLACFSPVIAREKIEISFNPVPNAPYLLGQPELNIDAEEFTTVVLRLKASKSGTARLFWATNFDPQMNQPKSIWFYLKRSEAGRNYVFHIPSQNPYWNGWVGQLLIYPENGDNQIEVIYAQVEPSKIFTIIRSGWGEFWGPRGREVIGSTINTLQSPNLFGRSIYVYLYWIIGLAAVFLLLWGFNRRLAQKRPEPFPVFWQKIGTDLFWVIIALWGLLEISSMYSQYLIQGGADLKYLGKSSQEKLILANTGDFYPFMLFCQKHLPAGAQFDMRTPPLYNDIKTKYYLYPCKLSAGAEHLVVYDQTVEPSIEANYYIWQQFRPGAYIMRRKQR